MIDYQITNLVRDCFSITILHICQEAGYELLSITDGNLEDLNNEDCLFYSVKVEVLVSKTQCATYSLVFPIIREEVQETALRKKLNKLKTTIEKIR